MLRIRCGLTLAALVVALATVGCGSGGTSRMSLVVDTDLSSDDVLALLYLAQDPGVDLRAVTVSGTGLVHCPGGGADRAGPAGGGPPPGCARRLWL